MTIKKRKEIFAALAYEVKRQIQEDFNFQTISQTCTDFEHGQAAQIYFCKNKEDPSKHHHISVFYNLDIQSANIFNSTFIKSQQI